jgi:exopolysaccharide biosynthesis WecB/TagA/CpsF family protein
MRLIENLILKNKIHETYESITDATKQTGILITLNPEWCITYDNDVTLLDGLDFSSVIDSVVISGYINFVYKKKYKRITGTDIFEYFLNSSDSKEKIVLWGASEEVRKKIEKDYELPNAQNGWSPNLSCTSNEMILEKAKSLPKKSIVFTAFNLKDGVGLSKLILRNRNDLFFIQVGGAFDTTAGRYKRAPKSLQQYGLEWLWKIFQDPKRLKRQLFVARYILLFEIKRFLKIQK